jgi:drug/metabolite transporter (DMT)-like permease
VEHSLGVGFALIAALGFGATAVFARLGMRHVRPTSGTSVSLIVGAALTMIIAFTMHATEIFALALAAFGFMFLNAALSYPIGRLFNFIGVQLAGASRASIIVGAAPLFSAGLAVWLLDEKISAPVLAGTVLIIIGIGVVLSSRRTVAPDPTPEPESDEALGQVSVGTDPTSEPESDEAISRRAQERTL